MDILQIAAQAFGFVGFALMVYSYQERDNKRLIAVQGLAGLAFFINFIMIGALSAALFNITNFVRALIFADKKKSTLKLLVSELLYTVCFVISLGAVWNDPVQLFLSSLTFVAILVMTYFMWKGNGAHIRYAQLILGSPAWLIYDSINLSIGGILTEILSMISVVISLIRYRNKGFEK